MALTEAKLSEIVADLIRPGSGKHERVRTHVQTLLTIGLGLPSADVEFEQQVRIHEVRGRIDALLGRTIFEFKSNLRAEIVEAERELLLYLAEREEKSGERYVGIATDGAEFLVYERRGAAIVEIGSYATVRDKPQELLNWLEIAVAAHDDVAPEPETVALDLGRESLAYGRARRELGAIWASVATVPDVVLKRQLWAQQLERVYGSTIESDELFFQHTYLTIAAKTMATAVVGIPLPEPGALMSGQAFEDAAISGAVESDFFDWVLEAPESADLIRRIARQVMRFRLRDAQVDVLKGLYESLIDPGQRHDLGEYYTPDWLAARICERAITSPLEQRVLDPACGSGTFVFHAVRRFLAAADAAGWDNSKALHECGQKVFGIDVHPVAAIIARVTYLLALGERLGKERGRVNVPVYLGDSMQWNTTRFVAEGEVLIGLEGSELLHFPAAVARDPGRFDEVVDGMLLHSEQGAPEEGFRAWLKRVHGVSGADGETLVATYKTLKRLYDEDRDHIWGYVARNLSRPVWLSSAGQRADVLVGNPPWLSYRFMSKSMQARFRAEAGERGLWAGGNVATQQDLSAFFFAKCAELYLKAGGLIAFVMPIGVLNLKQYEGFRSGWFGVGRFKSRHPKLVSEVRFTEAWTFDERVKPLFPTLTAVVFAENRSATKAAMGLPDAVLAFRGTLPRRDATPEEVLGHLRWAAEPLPTAAKHKGGSIYRQSFHNGATLYPRVLVVVERVTAGGLGGDASTPLVRSHRSRQEKPPWNVVSALQAPVEREFVRPVLFGESIAPFRVLGDSLAVIAWENGLLDAELARRLGRPRLAAWLRDAESLWQQNRKAETKDSLTEQLDHMGKLSGQFPIDRLRVLYSKAGTLPAACILRDSDAVIDHKLYWAAVSDEREARYLVAILNSETARSRVASMQGKGQWGARDFDKVMFELPIPKFDASVALHSELSTKGAEAEAVAATVDVSGVGFVAARGRIRQVLREDGVAGKIDELVARLLS